MEGLKLNGLVAERVRDEHFSAPPPKKKKSSPRIQFGTAGEGGAWGPLRVKEGEGDKDKAEQKQEAKTKTAVIPDDASAVE